MDAGRRPRRHRRRRSRLRHRRERQAARRRLPLVPTTTTATTTTPTVTTTTTAAPVKPRHINNFTVAYYGNRRTRTRDFAEAADLNPPFKLAWEFGGNALLEFPATIWGNNLYLIDDGATVKRVNITTGKQIWLRHVGLLSASTPSLDVKRKELFVSILSTTCGTIGCVDGEEAALSMRSGKILWTFPVSSGTESSPMIVGNSVYFGDQARHAVLAEHHDRSRELVVLDRRIDQGRPSLLATATSTSEPTAAASTPSAPRAAERPGRASPGGQFYSTPASAYGRVYVGNKNGDAYAFDRTHRRRCLEYGAWQLRVLGSGRGGHNGPRADGLHRLLLRRPVSR